MAPLECNCKAFLSSKKFFFQSTSHVFITNLIRLHPLRKEAADFEATQFEFQSCSRGRNKYSRLNVFNELETSRTCSLTTWHLALVKVSKSRIVMLFSYCRWQTLIISTQASHHLSDSCCNLCSTSCFCHRNLPIVSYGDEKWKFIKKLIFIPTWLELHCI